MKTVRAVVNAIDKILIWIGDVYDAVAQAMLMLIIAFVLVPLGLLIFEYAAYGFMALWLAGGVILAIILLGREAWKRLTHR